MRRPSKEAKEARAERERRIARRDPRQLPLPLNGGPPTDTGNATETETSTEESNVSSVCKAALTGKLVEATSYGDKVRLIADVTVNGETIPVTAFSRDMNVAKGFPIGGIVCLEGTPSFREFQNEMQLNIGGKVRMSRVKGDAGEIQITVDGKLTKAEPCKFEDGSDGYRVRLDIQTSKPRDEKDPKYSETNRFKTYDVPVFALAVGNAVEVLSELIEDEAPRAVLTGRLEPVAPIYIPGCDDPCLRMVACEAAAGLAASDGDFWNGTPKAPRATLAKIEKLAAPPKKEKDFNDEIPF